MMESVEPLTVEQLIAKLQGMQRRGQRKLLKQILPRYKDFPWESQRLLDALNAANVLDPQDSYEAQSRLKKYINAKTSG